MSGCSRRPEGRFVLAGRVFICSSKIHLALHIEDPAGASGTSTIDTTISGGFSSAIALSAAGQPTGVTVTFNSASVASPGSGSSIMKTAVASTTMAGGSYTLTVTGAGGGFTETSAVTLTVK
jgi:hypothetical protein